jgi:hypothetical protein
MDPQLSATGQQLCGFPAFFLRPITNAEFLRKIPRHTACLSCGSPNVNFKNFPPNPAPADFQTQD